MEINKKWITAAISSSVRSWNPGVSFIQLKPVLDICFAWLQSLQSFLKYEYVPNCEQNLSFFDPD
jgi:hypothetical protein